MSSQQSNSNDGGRDLSPEQQAAIERQADAEGGSKETERQARSAFLDGEKVQKMATSTANTEPENKAKGNKGG
ncbi:MAG: hypothetical protein Q9184_005611 [Pyrenodesmia sp. 2 TL-2023]